ncbi:MAG TPA: phenylacetate--CoA ligase [Chloroflexi bacterium]|jgi:phenylacetate-CoA ligase|nr:phenylacetate--CoA ligase [Chloroflexota bacterium]
MIWNPERETMSRGDLSSLQLELLQRQAARAYERVPFYRQAFRERGIHPQDIHSLDDLRLLPFTRKADFRDHYPFGLLAVTRRELARVHASSGTTGKPTVVAYTQADLAMWHEVCAREMVAGGITDEDMVQIAMGYGLFTGGIGWHYGAETLGATVVPASSGNTKRQIMLMQDFGTTVFCCTPSYAIYITEQAEEMGVDLASLDLRVGIHGAEPWSEGMRREIRERMGLDPIDTYGLSEMVGPGVAGECTHHCGMHISEDHFLPEIIDPETGEPLPYGERGELVLTALTKEALPIIRYRTGDITRLDPTPCACGRTHVRMEKVSGRTDDMLIVRGVNVFPSQIETVLLEVEGVQPHYQIVVDRERGAMDDLEVWVEVSEDVFTDDIGRLKRLQDKAEFEMRETLGIQARIKLVEPNRIARSMGKAKRIIDRRDVYGD